jgi:transcriptional regulator with GAF, ATPase, and Fis domain
VCGPELAGALDFLAGFDATAQQRIVVLVVADRPLEDEAVWALLAAGASDVLVVGDVGCATAAVDARLRQWREIDALRETPAVRSTLVGQGPAWRAMVDRVLEAALTPELPVLLTGESGTGKEVVARLIHRLDARADRRDLVVLDCTTVVPELSGSEFFGHEKGAFTGAVSARDGAFLAADKGTLFLDELGELPPRLQAELLRVTQEKSFKRVGSNSWLRTDFRLVCATNRDLAQERAESRFRSDLFYRIASLHIRLPSLAQRREDIPLLVEHFAREVWDGDAPPLDPVVRRLLVTRDYPGNIRELRQIVHRIYRRHRGPAPVSVGDLPEDLRPTGIQQPALRYDPAFINAIRRGVARGLALKEIGHAAEVVAEELVVAEEEGSLQRAAARLGVTDRALQLRRRARAEEQAPSRRRAAG